MAAKGFKSTVFGCFWHSWGTSKACNCYRFLRFDSASSGPKAIAHFALMHLRQQKIATYSVSATSVLAVHRLAMPCSHRINMEFQNSDQRCSLCTPCICDCCRMGVKITTCMDMHGSALVYIYIKIKIRVAQNVGKVWISRKKSWPRLGPLQAIFSMGRRNAKHR